MKDFEQLSDGDKRELLEKYGYEYNDDNNGDRLYSMDEFDELLRDVDPIDLACKVYYGEFCPSDDYFYFDGYDNLISVSDAADFYEENIYDIDDFYNWCDERGYLDDYLDDIEDEWIGRIEKAESLEELDTIIEEMEECNEELASISEVQDAIDDKRSELEEETDDEEE